MAYNSDAGMMTVMFFGGGARKEPASGGGGSYQGPLDLVPGADFSYSMYALSSVWTDPVIRVLDVTSLNEQNFSPTLSNEVDPSLVATFLGAHVGTVITYFDQSGNSKDVDDTYSPGGGPTWTPNALGSHPAGDFTSGWLGTASDVSITGSAYTLFAVLKCTGAAGSNGVSCINADVADPSALDFSLYPATNGIIIDAFDASGDFGATFTSATPFSAFVIMSTVIENGSKILRVNGASVSPDSSFNDLTPGTITEKLSLGARQATTGAGLFNGIICEVIGYSGAKTLQQIQSIEQNMSNRYGITLA